MPSRHSEGRTKTVNMSVVNDNEVTSLAATRLGLLVRRALQVREAAAQFEQDWPRLASRPAMPGFAWTELERQLQDLAPDALSPMVRVHDARHVATLLTNLAGQVHRVRVPDDRVTDPRGTRVRRQHDEFVIEFFLQLVQLQHLRDPVERLRRLVHRTDRGEVVDGDGTELGTHAPDGTHRGLRERRE
jgi:hypothetical protein